MNLLKVTFTSAWLLSLVVLGLVGCSTQYNALSVFDSTLPMPQHFTISEHTEITKQGILAAQKYAAFWNTGEERYAHEALATDFKDLHLPEGRVQGIEGALSASRFFRTVVPNLKADIKEMLITNNKVIVQFQFTGNFTGNFKEHKGQGQAIDFVAVDIYTIKEGKIIENWHLEDNLTLLMKMGVAKLQ